MIDAYVEKNPDAWPAFDSNGAFAGLIPTSGQPTNCTLVGNVLYVTAFGGGVYSIRLNVTGVDRNPTSIQQVTWGGVKANGLYGTAETVSGSADRNR